MTVFRRAAWAATIFARSGIDTGAQLGIASFPCLSVWKEKSGSHLASPDWREAVQS
jgi:hypothetical protein